MIKRAPWSPERRLRAAWAAHTRRAYDELRADRQYDARNGGPPYVEPTDEDIAARARGLFDASERRKRERLGRLSFATKIARARLMPEAPAPRIGAAESLVRRILRKRYQADLAALRGDQRKAERLRREADFLQRSLPAGVTLG